MNKKSILIFAKTKYTKTPYDQWLSGTEISPIIITTDEFAEGYRHMPEVYAFSNYDQNQLVEKTALKIARKNNLVGIFARAEADIIRAAQLRELIGLQGQHTESALAFRNKVMMKDYLRNSGVKLPKYCVISSAYRAIKFVEENNFPVVIKPFAESGSFGTHVIRNEPEFDEYLARTNRTDMAIETFVDGQMYHVDGLILNGKLVFIQPFKYINDCLSFRKNEYTGSSTVSPKDPIYSALIAATQKVLSALPIPRNTAFHAELWQTQSGEIVFCEIASRTGGGMISSSIKHSFGFDIDQEWLYAECGIFRPIQYSKYRPSGSVIIPPLVGVLEHVPLGNEPEFVREVQVTGNVGQRFNGGVKSGLFLAGYIVDGNTEAQVVQNMMQVAIWFSRNSKWRN